MKLKSLYIPFIIIIILTGGVTISKSLGIWLTESTKIPKKISSGTYAGEFDPSDIRGSYTFNDISKSFEVAPKDLAEAFNIITNNPQDIEVKSLEELYSQLEVEVGTDSVRKFVALYTGLPSDSEAVLPERAIELLYSNNKITDSEMEELLQNTIILPSSVTETPSISSEDNKVINGKTTVKEVLDYGVKLEQVEELLGVKISDKAAAIRDLCQEQEISFSTVKNTLTNLIEE